MRAFPYEGSTWLAALNPYKPTRKATNIDYLDLSVAHSPSSLSFIVIQCQNVYDSTMLHTSQCVLALTLNTPCGPIENSSTPLILTFALPIATEHTRILSDSISTTSLCFVHPSFWETKTNVACNILERYWIARIQGNTHSKIWPRMQRWFDGGGKCGCSGCQGEASVLTPPLPVQPPPRLSSSRTPAASSSALTISPAPGTKLIAPNESPAVMAPSKPTPPLASLQLSQKSDSRTPQSKQQQGGDIKPGFREERNCRDHPAGHPDTNPQDDRLLKEHLPKKRPLFDNSQNEVKRCRFS